MKAKKTKSRQRYPNLATILMVEKFLKENKAEPMKITEIKTSLPKQIMHKTLRIIIEYLHESGKIIHGPKGVQWIYAKPRHIKKMLEDSLEI